MKTCNIKGCEQFIFSSGFCSKHYSRLRETGTVVDGPRARGSVVDRLWRQIDIRSESECWPWKAKSLIKGYGVIGFGSRVGGKILAHRLVWMLTHKKDFKLNDIQSPECRIVVMHTCDNRLCCNPAHLVIGTQKDNVHDMDAKGRRVNRQVKGEMHGNAKLTDDAVRSIRADSRKHKEIANDYGVTRANVSYIKRRTAWKHIE